MPQLFDAMRGEAVPVGETLIAQERERSRICHYATQIINALSTPYEIDGIELVVGASIVARWSSTCGVRSPAASSSCISSR